MVTAHTPLAQHRAAPRGRGTLAMAMMFVVVIGGTTGAALGHMTGARADVPTAAAELTDAGGVEATAEARDERPAPDVATELPTPEVATAEATTACDRDGVSAALDSGDSGAVLEAFGGAAAFREAVAAGTAPCIELNDARWPWLVVNKHIALEPLEYEPPDLTSPAERNTPYGYLRAAATDAMDEMIAAAAEAGAGGIAVTSAYRSYATQESLFTGYVNSAGAEAAEATSARPGHSEHQTGLAADVVPCDYGCAGMDAFGGTAQSEWVIENGWRYGFIVRYEEGRTDVSGYSPEPWHLRYIGPELAEVYHEGGYHTLEDFFGLDPAPDYVD
ncbi:M15 family metallopeptidase [Microbacterium halophytorum]|uniref:M15 family metallopeptidase n=1 Tax=Microbacterium halophytorum TaxID=2067568 RepID=UPI001E314F7C|nr:M15 family metallopeptidase [Microbacterium halophytorum]